MSITIEAQATRTLIQQDGVSIVAINDNGSMELLTPPSVPTGNMVTTFNQFGNSLSANGYQRLPSGLIVQWGSFSAGVTSYSFPIAFPTAFASISCMQAGAASASIERMALISTPTISGFTTAPVTSNKLPAYWIAIGY